MIWKMETVSRNWPKLLWKDGRKKKSGQKNNVLRNSGKKLKRLRRSWDRGNKVEWKIMAV